MELLPEFELDCNCGGSFSCCCWLRVLLVDEEIGLFLLLLASLELLSTVVVVDIEVVEFVVLASFMMISPSFSLNSAIGKD